MLDYRGALPDTGARTFTRLEDEPQDAARTLRERVTDCAPERRGVVRSAS